MKAFFGYIAGFVVVTATFENGTQNEVMRYLKKNWHALPSGKLHYVAGYFAWIRTRPEGGSVLYRMLPTTGIFVRGGRFVFYSKDMTKTTLRTIRGTIDFDRFAIEANEFNYELQWHRNKETQGRFRVEKVIGAEKGMGVCVVHAGRGASFQKR